MHVLGDHVDGKINKNGLWGQYYASHLGTCCHTSSIQIHTQTYTYKNVYKYGERGREREAIHNTQHL